MATPDTPGRKPGKTNADLIQDVRNRISNLYERFPELRPNGEGPEDRKPPASDRPDDRKKEN